MIGTVAAGLLTSPAASVSRLADKGDVSFGAFEFLGGRNQKESQSCQYWIVGQLQAVVFLSAVM